MAGWAIVLWLYWRREMIDVLLVWAVLPCRCASSGFGTGKMFLRVLGCCTAAYCSSPLNSESVTKMPILPACPRQTNLSSLFEALENLCFLHRAGTFALLPPNQPSLSGRLFDSLDVTEKKQKNDCEFVRQKVDVVLANLNFVYFFLACDVSDVLFWDQPCCRHSAFWHWARGSIALGMISVHDRKGMCFCNHKIISSLHYGFAVPWLCSSTPHKLSFPVPCTNTCATHLHF